MAMYKVDSSDWMRYLLLLWFIREGVEIVDEEVDEGVVDEVVVEGVEEVIVVEVDEEVVDVDVILRVVWGDKWWRWDGYNEKRVDCLHHRETSEWWILLKAAAAVTPMDWACEMTLSFCETEYDFLILFKAGGVVVVVVVVVFIMNRIVDCRLQVDCR